MMNASVVIIEYQSEDNEVNDRKPFVVSHNVGMVASYSYNETVKP